jgi:glutathionylspermidine synthase
MNRQLLSSLNEHLATELLRDPKLAAVRFDLHHRSIPEFMYGYPYAVNAWPIFVTPHLIRDHFEPLIASMPRVLYQALHVSFTDSNAMADYFGWPEMICSIIEQSPVDARDLLIRYDAVLDASGLKLLENNSGSSAGGWQNDYFQRQMLPSLATVAQSHQSSFSYRPILHSLLKALVSGISRCKPEGASGNLLIYWTFSPGGPNLADFNHQLQLAYDAVRPPELAEGRVVIFRDFEEISFTAGGEVVVGGEIIDAIILGDILLADIPPMKLNRLIAAYLRGQIVFPDSPFHVLLSNKELLALMHECHAARLLDADDCALIERYVPWTARLIDQEVLLEGIRVPLIQHLLAHRNDFVLKKSDSSSGRDVIVGRHVDAADWERSIRTYAGSQSHWIVQQFCAPSMLEMYDPALGVVPHALVWGIFSYGGEYAGAFVRTDRGVTKQGVINSATGAMEMPVFEAN